MSKLCQIIAVESGEKARGERTLTDAYHLFQKGALLSGITKSYSPLDEEKGEPLPSERTLVQVRATEVIDDVVEGLSSLLDVTATKDYANCLARANVVVDGEAVLEDVPVTYLLFLEKQLVNIRTFISKLPTLDPAEEWAWSTGQNCWATPVVETAKTKKVKTKIVLADATEHHPAQVELYDIDERVGTWKTIKYSGAMEASRVKALLKRVEALQAAVKFAREAANSIDAPKQTVGKKVFDFILGV
jgi:archaellum component FlaF (FlaF/FlaG flagellin family)